MSRAAYGSEGDYRRGAEALRDALISRGVACGLEYDVRDGFACGAHWRLRYHPTREGLYRDRKVSVVARLEAELVRQAAARACVVLTSDVDRWVVRLRCGGHLPIEPL